MDDFWTPDLIYAVKYYYYDNGRFHSAHFEKAFVADVWYEAECNPRFVGETCFDGVPATRHIRMYPTQMQELHPYKMLCGFYGLKQMPDERPIANTLVAFKGKVVEHEKGYRAQHQRIIRRLGFEEISTGIVKELNV